MESVASNSLCYVRFDSFQVQNLVQVIEMIQYHKQKINKLTDQLINNLKRPLMVFFWVSKPTLLNMYLFFLPIFVFCCTT